MVPQDTANGCYSRFAPNIGMPSVIVRQARYNFLSLRTWRDRLTESIFEEPGVNALAIDYKSNSIVISVDATPSVSLTGVLLSAGLPDDAYRFETERRPTPQAPCSAGSNGPTVEGCFRPVPGGVKIFGTPAGGDPAGTCDTRECCTMGVSVYRWMAEFGSPYWQMGYVTNSHCVPPMVAVYGNYIHQPSNDPDQFIAFEWIDPYGWVCGSYRCRYSDSAWLWSYGGEGENQRIARTQYWNGNKTIDTNTPRFIITGSRAAVQDMDMEKVGQKTGWTYGQVSAVCTDEISAAGPKMVCQDRVNYSSDGGDSGSPVFFWKWWDGPSNVDLVGIHWGATFSYKVYSPWSGVAADLGSMF